jgi:3-mercaptopyruvate sulfurtransferase SseA
MNWHTWIIIGSAVAAFLVLKRLMLVRPAAARDWLKKGARVIDVRSQGEFQGGHLPDAVNVPLDRLRDDISQHAPDKEQPLLRKMGYRNVFNLGSYGRAAKILGAHSELGKKE